jgi:competence protein ComEC
MILLWSLLSVCLLLFLSVSFLSPYKRFRNFWMTGLLIQALSFSSGALLLHYKDIRNDPQWQGRMYKEGDGVLVSLIDQPVERKNSMRVTGKFSCLIRNGQKIPVKGDLLIYFEKNIYLSAGDQLLLTKPLEKIKNTGNPGDFDYVRYCLFNNITARVFLKKEDICIVKHISPGFLSKKLAACRGQIVAVLKKYIPDEKRSGLAEALLIGYKDDLDKEISKAYANTGTVHIIAISGMHLGLIYGLLLFMLRPLPGSKQTEWIRTLFILSTLWIFSFLCGAQPSILRSTIMFSFILIGQRAGRRTSVYNSLAGSAFLLLCIDPFWLWDPGFQLSYAAITGILLFYRSINNWYFSDNKLVSGIWSLMAVTIAAQILTFPISVYHFHQFPLLFLFSNLLAVPLSSLILVGEIILYILSFIPFIAAVLGKIISLLIGWMNGYIQHIDSIPRSTIKGLEIDQWQVLLLYLSGLFLWSFFENRKAGYLKLCGAFMIAFLSIRLTSFHEAAIRQKIIVYNLAGGSAMDIISGRNAWFMGQSDPGKEQTLYPTRSLMRIKKIFSFSPMTLFHFSGKQIMVAENIEGIDSSLHIDLLILRGAAKFDSEELPGSLHIDKVVLDASLPFKKASLIEQYCLSLGIPVHNIRREGAYLVDIP